MGVEHIHRCGEACLRLRNGNDNSRGRNSSLKELRQVKRQLGGEFSRHAQHLHKILPCMEGEHCAKKDQGKRSKERTKKEPADQKFLGAVGISGEGKEQGEEGQDVETGKLQPQNGFLDHGLKHGFVSAGKKRRTAR
jgi:hypothetical protein